MEAYSPTVRGKAASVSRTKPAPSKASKIILEIAEDSKTANPTVITIVTIRKTQSISFIPDFAANNVARSAFKLNWVV